MNLINSNVGGAIGDALVRANEFQGVLSNS